MENKKNCPFKKRIKMNRSQGIYQDMFAWCDGERCMAFKDGKCLRLERVEPITYRGLENPWIKCERTGGVNEDTKAD